MHSRPHTKWTHCIIIQSQLCTAEHTLSEHITSFNDVIQYQGFVDDRDVSAQNMNSAVCQTLSVDHYTPVPQTIVTSLTYNSYNIINFSIYIGALFSFVFCTHLFYLYCFWGYRVVLVKLALLTGLQLLPRMWPQFTQLPKVTPELCTTKCALKN